ncbi:MAG: lipoate--protein ligase family protein [Promethearchaeota archaeon]
MDGFLNWRFLPVDTYDGPTNMAIDEAILEARIKGEIPNTIRLYQWSPSTVSIGRHQSVSLEVDVDEIKKLNFQLVRRISGGGAVLHAEGMEITYSVVVHKRDLLQCFPVTSGSVSEIYNIIMLGIQKTVQKMGLHAEVGAIGCPALFLDGKKISGNAQCARKNVILQHGTILLRVDPEVMYRVLKPPEGVSRGRMVRSVKAKVMGLEEKYGKKIEVRAFNDLYFESFNELLGGKLEQGHLESLERELTSVFLKKYKSKEWSMKYP